MVEVEQCRWVLARSGARKGAPPGRLTTALALANGIDNGALSTIRHVSASAGRSRNTRQHELSVSGARCSGTSCPVDPGWLVLTCLRAAAFRLAGAYRINLSRTVGLNAHMASLVFRGMSA